MKQTTIEIKTPSLVKLKESLKVDGDYFTVRQSIPHLEKEEMAKERMALSVIFNEELGLCYKAINETVVILFVMLKYYTNLNLEAFYDDEKMYELYDSVGASDELIEILTFISSDYRETLDVYNNLFEIQKLVFERKHSIGMKLWGLFGGLADGEAQKKIVEEARDVNNMLIDALGQSQSQKKRKDVRVGGALLSLAKKQNR